MSNIAIKVEDLGKKYVINHNSGNGDDNFREVVIASAKKIVNSLNPFSKSSKNDEQSSTEDFWALNNVNFTINKGDKVGIIGRNGAGKSTLLKVLSRITEPTTGKIHINGRIASLLEVGTGFHPELTGRENIYLNGAILGMSRKEIKAKFDEIVAFAEVDKFLDTPVKRYSSGMYVRLAFSVAAHLEPEILVVDEVLAVGDVAFQKKCLAKMNDVAEEGRTIILVSHNMAAIQKLCSKVIFMESGELQHIGEVDDIIDKYMLYGQKELTKNQLSLHTREKGLGENIKINSLKLLNSKMEETDTFKFGELMYFEITAIGLVSLKDLQLVIGIDSIYGDRIATTISARKLSFNIDTNETIQGVVQIQECFIPGTYSVTTAIRQEEKTLLDRLTGIATFTVETIRDPNFSNETFVQGGYIHMPHSIWHIEKK